MKLTSIELSGYRGYGVPTCIDFDALTVLSGKNDAGKSSVFEALDMFLSGAKPEAGDFSVGGDGTISIACTFEDLPPALVLDAATTTTFKDEHLLDHEGRLRIKKIYRGTRAPEVFAVAVHPVTSDGRSLLTLKQKDLKELAKEVGVEEPEGDKRSNTTFRRAIWGAWAEPDLSKEVPGAFPDDSRSVPTLTEVPLNIEDGKQVASALENYYPLFHLFKADRDGSESDSIAQDPAKAIVKTVLDRHSEELNRLTTEITAEIKGLLDDVVVRLKEVANPLGSSLRPRDIEPSWQKAFTSLRFVDENEVPLSKRGSGTRRLVLLSFFRAEAERNIDDSSGWHRGVIIAVEEPETALHPDLQREAVAALTQVSELPYRQIMLTTHSSNLIRHLPIKSVRFAKRKDDARTWVSSAKIGQTDLLLELNKTMGIFTDHNVKAFVLVEGKNDIAGLLSLSDSLKDREGYPDLANLELGGELCFMPIGGCGAAALWESRLSPLRRHEIHILDSDRDSADALPSEGTRAYRERIEQAQDDRLSVHVLTRRELENYLTIDSILHEYSDQSGFEMKFRDLVKDVQNWDYADVPELVAQACHEVDSEVPWDDLDKEKRKKKESSAKTRLAKCFDHPTVTSPESEFEQTDLSRLLKRIGALVGGNNWSLGVNSSKFAEVSNPSS